MNTEPTSDEDPEVFKKQRGKAYLQQPHEIWARASQAMHNLRYTVGTAEFDETIRMIPLKLVVTQFRTNFKWWNNISDKAKRRLVKAVANQWNEVDIDLKQKMHQTAWSSLSYAVTSEVSWLRWSANRFVAISKFSSSFSIAINLLLLLKMLLELFQSPRNYPK